LRLWNAYFNTETDRHEKIEWYLAQVAMAIDQSMGLKKGRRRQLKDYLIKFAKPKPAPKDSEAAKKWALTWIQNLAAVSKMQKKDPRPARKK